MMSYVVVSTSFIVLSAAQTVAPPPMPSIALSPDKHSFVYSDTGRPFTPWGFNYDHDSNGRLIEDYWETEWPFVEAHFEQMKALGANVVRVHLQTAKFMPLPDKPNGTALNRLADLVKLAERVGLYLDLTGLGCYHKKDVPAWYDAMDEGQRWDVQARFWQAIAAKVGSSPAIFCYDLMNEPVVPGGKRNDGDWLGPPFAGKHFVQFITLDRNGRPRPEIAKQWISHLVHAIRAVDKRTLVTVGMVDWSLDRPGLTSGFVPQQVAGDLDFLCVHVYPERGKIEQARETLKGFAIGKPVVVEETFPLKCGGDELERFIDDSKQDAAGWISFYWGKPREELRRSGTIADGMVLDWLNRFEKRAKAMQP